MAFCGPKPIPRLAKPATAASGVTLIPTTSSAVSAAAPRIIVTPTVLRIPASRRVCSSRISATRACDAAGFTSHRVISFSSRIKINAATHIPARRMPSLQVNSGHFAEKMVIQYREPHYIIGMPRARGEEAGRILSRRSWGPASFLFLMQRKPPEAAEGSCFGRGRAMIRMMNASDRRSFLGMIFTAAAGLAAIPSRLESQQPAKRPPYPDQKPGENEPEVKPDPRALLKETQTNIKKDSERLVGLAEDLKKEGDKTDSADALSLQMVKKAEEIEKLARQIKNRARG